MDGCRIDASIGVGQSNIVGIDRNVSKCIQTPNGKIRVFGLFHVRGTDELLLIDGVIEAVEIGTTFYNIGDTINVSNDPNFTEIECIESGCDCES